MNKPILLTIILMIMSLLYINAQENENIYRFPSIKIKNLESEDFNIEILNEEEKPFIVVFWKACCRTGVLLLNELSEIYEDEELEGELNVYAISVDDLRTITSAKNHATTNDWPFEVLFDTNEDVKRAMGVNMEPYIFVFKESEIIWSKNAYYEGITEEIINIVK